MRRTILVLALFSAAVVPCFAQGFGNECSPAGTWYGGGESTAKYLLTIVPTRAGHFAMTFDEGFTPAIPKLTEFSGELIKQSNGEYKGHALALANSSSTPPPMGGPVPAIWAVREHGRMVDCNTLEFEIDFFAVYIWGHIPFVDPPDGNRLPAGPVKEKYSRMATSCPACGDEVND